MDKRAELIAEMEVLAKSIEEIEERIDSEENESKKEVWTEELGRKTAEFEQKEKAVARLDEKAKRADRLAALKPKKDEKPEEKPEVSKKAELGEVSVELPDSEHNRGNYEAKKDAASWLYLSHSKSGAAALGEIASKSGDELVKAITLTRIEAKEDVGAVKPPRWMREFIMPKSTAMSEILSDPVLAKAFADFDGKASSNDVLVRDPSGTNSGGGSLVDTTFDPRLVKREINMVHDIPSKCYVKRAVGKTAVFPKLSQDSTTPFGVAITRGNGSSGNSGEGTAITESNPVFSQIEISTGRIAALSQASKKEVRNADVPYEAELAWMFRNACLFAYGQDIIEGSDTLFTNCNLPLGINTNTSINTYNVATRARQVAAQVSYTDVSRMPFDVDEGITDEGMFIISGGASGAMQYMVSLDDSDGRPVFFSEKGGYINWGLGQSGPTGAIVNRPYLRTKANSRAVGGRGDVIYGNLRHYGFVVDVDEMGVERSDEYAFNTGLVTFRLITYVGGRVLNGEAFCVLADVAGVSSSSSSSSSSST